jgi:hypothetical protein
MSLRLRGLDPEWAGAVLACLVEFHEFSRNDAEQALEKLVKHLAAAPSPIGRRAINLVTHAEPFDIACDISKRKLDLAKLRQQYESILYQAHSVNTSPHR